MDEEKRKRLVEKGLYPLTVQEFLDLTKEQVAEIDAVMEADKQLAILDAEIEHSDRAFRIRGVICTNTLEFNQWAVLDAFIEWLEGRGWEFGGTLGEIDEAGEYIGDKEEE